MIVAATATFDDNLWHYVKAGGGKVRASICGKVVRQARNGWKLGKHGNPACKDCTIVAKRKYGIE
jgi:hypothetical protein